MAGLSSGERRVLGLAAVFLVLMGSCFFFGQGTDRPLQVTVEVQQEEPAAVRPDSLLEGEVIDLNTADEWTLQRLPGIGAVRARAIVEYRQEHGPFAGVEELERVKGIGPVTVAGLEGLARAGE